MRRARYRPQARLLETQFTSGEIYLYKSVPEQVYEELLSAESKGRYFQQHIRGQFPYRRAVV